MAVPQLMMGYVISSEASREWRDAERDWRR
jgi:hypothetical protein